MNDLHAAMRWMEHHVLDAEGNMLLYDVTSADIEQLQKLFNKLQLFDA